MTPISDAALRHLRMIGDVPDLTATKYRLEAPLGRGGMGSVYLARDGELDRLVALKVVDLPNGGTDAVGRLEREARVLARLEHPGIVPVHDVGRLPDGRAFYAMKLVRGDRLDRYLAADTPLAERLRIFGRIADAVSFAHAEGVIHRDLKPQNVMIGPFGEVLVMDWGVAKLAGGAEPAAADGGAAPGGSGPSTDAGTVLGTPGYMAPEQARGDPGAVDRRADVYGLGAVLAFLLTGHDPEPDGPIRFPPDVPRRLKAIVRRALAPDPPDRYPGAPELAEDVRRFESGRPVAAYHESMIERAGRLISRYRTPIALVLVYVAVRLALLLVGR